MYPEYCDLLNFIFLIAYFPELHKFSSSKREYVRYDNYINNLCVTKGNIKRVTGALNGKLLDVKRRTVERILDMLSESTHILHADKSVFFIKEKVLRIVRQIYSVL